jgi:hypothetical protein
VKPETLAASATAMISLDCAERIDDKPRRANALKARIRFIVGFFQPVVSAIG